MSDDIINKISALLALAADGDTPVEEARTAAHLAAQLIARHGLRVVLASGAPPAPPSGRTDAWPSPEPAPRSPPPAPPSGLPPEESWPREPPRDWPREPPCDPFSPPRKRRWRAKAYVAGRSRTPGTCISCRAPYRRGDEVASHRGAGSTHWGCRAYWATGTPASPGREGR
jgi:hypothetical protein